MTTGRGRYHAYLLRLWCVDANGEVVWRASIEDPHTGERHGFAKLDRLYEFLEEQTREIKRGESQATNQTIDTKQITSDSCE
jgi:hypothetical protein